MKYQITFYNAIWLVLFASLFLSFSWWVFGVVFLFAPTWKHLRDWYDEKKQYEQYLSKLDAESGDTELPED